MNDNTRDLSQQDSEELLVTSTSSSITVESIVFLSETEATESDTSTATTATTTTTTGLCQIVTSSTGNNNNFTSVNDEDDSVASIDDRLGEEGADAKDDSGSSPTMGGTSSNNDAETCVLPTSSNYIEQSSENTKNNMVITRSAGSSTEFSIRSDVLVSPTTSSASTISAPTTRSKRKLLNESGGTTSLNRNNSISLNNKTIKLDIKNHQSPMTTRKSSAASINSLPHQGDKVKSEEKPGTTAKSGSTVGGRHPTVGRVTINDCDASTSSSSSSSCSSNNTNTNKLIIKINNCINDVDSNDKVEESHSEKNDIATCTMSTAGDNNDEPNLSRVKTPLVSSCDNDDRTSNAGGESRKVEPLKINLNRDAVKTKITIKPIVRPINVDNENPGSPIPKLTIKSPSILNILSTSGDSKATSNGSEQQLPIEPHIVPKLTIRASDCNSSLTNADVKHTVVPKLTIKMDGVINCVKESSLNSSSSSASPSPPPLPKLTIKTSGDITESIISKISPKSTTSSQCHIVSTSSVPSFHSTSQTTTVPKLTIKPIPKPSTSNGSDTLSTVPKLTIKPIPLRIATSSCNESAGTDEAALSEKTTVPKLTIRTGVEPSVKIQNSELMGNTVPKLTIRTVQESSDSTEKTQTVPKFTIKSVQESTQSIPKLTIAVNDSTSSSSCSSPTNERIPKLTIRQVEQDETDRIPKLMISSVQDSDDVEKVPKLTIKPIQDTDTVDRVPKITLKSFSEPDDKEGIPKLTIKTVLDSSESVEKIPKLTIRHVQDSDHGDNLPKLKVTSVQESESVLAVPKLMIKQIQDAEEKVPKLTIISKSSCDDTTKVRKLKIKTVQDSSSTTSKMASLTQETDTVDRISKLEVRTTEPLDGEKIPKLTIRQVLESEKDGRIPKLTIVQSSSVSHTETNKETEYFLKAKSPKRTNDEHCEEDKTASKLLRLSPKNDYTNLPGESSFRKEEEKETEKEKEKGLDLQETRKVESATEDDKKKENQDSEIIEIQLKSKEQIVEDKTKEEKERDIDKQSASKQKVDSEKEAKSEIETESKVQMDSERESIMEDEEVEQMRTEREEAEQEKKAEQKTDAELEKETELEKESERKNEAKRENDAEFQSEDQSEETVVNIDLESESKTEVVTRKVEQEEENGGITKKVEEEDKIGKIYVERAPELPEIINLDQEPDIIYVEQDSQELPTINTDSLDALKINNDDDEDDEQVPMFNEPCNIPIENTPQSEDAKLFPITDSVDLTTPSPGSSPVHLVSDDSNQKLLYEEMNENEVRNKLIHAFETIQRPTTSVEDFMENCKEQLEGANFVTDDDVFEGEKLFEINCGPISNESTRSPKVFSDQIIENSEDNMSMPSEEQLLNSNSRHPSPYREDQSKSTENSNEPAHLDEKFLSNVDVLSCLGICQENANNASFNATDADDDVLRRNNNKEATTAATKTTTATTDSDNSVESNQDRNKLKRCAESTILSDPEAPPSKRVRCDTNNITQNAIPDSLSSESESSTSLLVQSVSMQCTSSTDIKESSNIIESETSCDEKFSTLIELKSFEVVDNDDENGGTTKDDDCSIVDLKRIFSEDKLETVTLSSQSDTNENLPKSLDTKIDVIHEENQDNVISIRTRQNVLLINEESGSDGMMVDECTSDPLSAFSNPTDDKKSQEVDSGVDISSSVKSESVPEVPVKRPRGRPRKDGRPAGSVKKPEKKIRDSSGVLIRKKFKGCLLEAQQITEVLVTPGKRGCETNMSPDGTPLQEFTLDSFEKTDISTPLTALGRPLRGRGSRGGRINRSTGRGSRGGRGGRGRIAQAARNRPRGIGGLTHTPDKDANFFSPERRKTIDSKTPKPISLLQLFEEDTRMSADSISTPVRQSEIINNEDTQSSMQSSVSALEGSSTIKKRAKMEVIAPEGKTEYTVDMIAEYDWPPPKGCCPAKNRDTFMIQEQIAQYLGIKSFKRKYPDLPRRQIEMEERNYLREKGLVTEKMCDLGITAVWASDVLDIMYSDFYDKYEEYKNYLRQKQMRDIEAKQKALAAEAVDKGLQARERALESASKWNSNFNKVRKEDRRLCLDLQSLVIQIPSAVGKKMSRPNVLQQPPSQYPVALVPGQFAENYRSYTSQELRCYPINTVLDEPDAIIDRLRPEVECDETSSSESESSDSSSSESDSDSSSGDSDSDDSSSLTDEEEPPDENLKCFVCHHPQNRNRNGMPEVFIRCGTCRRRTHPSCISMPRRMVNRVRTYNWQCAECKCCIKCKRKQEDNKMLFCEQCDRGYHIYCLQIKNIPEGRWHCEQCAVCIRCGSRKPEGYLPPPTPTPPLTNPEDKKKANKKKAKWVLEYKLDHLTKIREHFSILCVPCARLKMNRPKS